MNEVTKTFILKNKNKDMEFLVLQTGFTPEEITKVIKTGKVENKKLNDYIRKKGATVMTEAASMHLDRPTP